jgi:hypothetical protein
LISVGADQIEGEYIVILDDGVLPEDVATVAESLAGDGVEVVDVWSTAEVRFLRELNRSSLRCERTHGEACYGP